MRFRNIAVAPNIDDHARSGPGVDFGVRNLTVSRHTRNKYVVRTRRTDKTAAVHEIRMNNGRGRVRRLAARGDFGLPAE